MSNVTSIKPIKTFNVSDDPEFAHGVLGSFFGLNILVCMSDIKNGLKSGGYSLLMDDNEQTEPYMKNAVLMWLHAFSNTVFETELLAITSFISCVNESREIYGIGVEFDPETDLVCPACDLFMDVTSASDHKEKDDYSCPVCDGELQSVDTLQENINPYTYYVPMAD